MAVFDRLHMPSLDGATQWLNSEPLSLAELRGRGVLVNFWTFTCINWLRQEPYVRAWSQAYREDGLVVIGVHTPEFSSTKRTAFGRRRRTGRSTIRSCSINSYEICDRDFERPRDEDESHPLHPGERLEQVGVRG
jgi:thiol-disulfide isomerase/thioredoxin